MSINVGTPDWQRGVVSAQKLLATFPAGQALGVVDLPSNVSSLIVLIENNHVAQLSGCQGMTSGSDYPVAPYSTTGSGYQHNAWVVAVGSAQDSQVTLVWNAAPTEPWVVIGDASTRMVADLSLLNVTAPPQNFALGNALIVAGVDGSNAYALATDQSGVLYSIPTVPGIGAGDHPKNEILCAPFDNVGGGTTILAAPGAGKRYRIFGGTLVNVGGAGAFADIQGVVNDQAWVFIHVDSSGITHQFTAPLTGIPTDADTAITTASSAPVELYGACYYTLETI